MIRLGSTILFKKGYCYQSYGWNLIRPLGKLQNIVSHLDQYLIDDITILRPIREDEDQSDLIRDLDELKELKSSSPISFGGGIRNVNQLQLLKGLPFERFVFSSVLFKDDDSLLETATNLYGKQAIIGLIPFKLDPKLSVFNSQLNKFVLFEDLKNLEFCDEIILYDCQNEGKHTGFNTDIINRIGINQKKCVFSGGASRLIKLFENDSNAPKAISIENSILHREFSKSNYYEKL